MYQLVKTNQWINWKGKEKKPCGSINTVRLPFSMAMSTVMARKADGIGFVLTKDDPYVVIDLDKCMMNGKLDNTATEITTRFKKTYQEISPSTTGIHIWCKGKMEKSGVRRGTIEIYSAQRYMTVTLNPINNVPITNCQEEIEWLMWNV